MGNLEKPTSITCAQQSKHTLHLINKDNLASLLALC